jgi:hypothetical protein
VPIDGRFDDYGGVFRIIIASKSCPAEVPPPLHTASELALCRLSDANAPEEPIAKTLKSDLPALGRHESAQELERQRTLSRCARFVLHLEVLEGQSPSSPRDLTTAGE